MTDGVLCTFLQVLNSSKSRINGPSKQRCRGWRTTEQTFAFDEATANTEDIYNRCYWGLEYVREKKFNSSE